MPDDLRARIAEALLTTPAGFVQAEPDGVEQHARREWHRHDRHRYHATCALCRGEEDTLTEAVMKVVQPELDRLAGVERERDALRAELDDLLDQADADAAGPNPQITALLDHLAEVLPAVDPVEEMQHYERQARVGHRRARRARDRRLATEAERDKALAALQAVREAQSLGEALAAVARHDGLTTDLINTTTEE